MKLFATAALLAVSLLPVAAPAQQVQQPYPYPSQMQGAPNQQREPKIFRKWERLLGNLNLSGQQQAQIQGLIEQYAQAHPQGSPRDPQAGRALREQIFQVLSPQQQEALRQEIVAQREQRLQRQMQRLQQQQQGQASAPPIR